MRKEETRCSLAEGVCMGNPRRSGEAKENITTDAKEESHAGPPQWTALRHVQSGIHHLNKALSSAFEL